jgi:hypothetical protein
MTIAAVREDVQRTQDAEMGLGPLHRFRGDDPLGHVEELPDDFVLRKLQRVR